MKGKVCLITGANSGIGKETAQALADFGATVVMVCRNVEKGKTARNEIIQQTGNQNVGLIIADMGSQKQVHRLSESFRSQYNSLHVLINNAGLILGTRSSTEDGLETTLAVNHLGPFLLTHLLLDLIKKSQPARIINVSSTVHKWARIRFDDLNWEKGYKPMKVYSQSKLANILFTYQLAKKLEGEQITVNALHPGVIGSNFGQSGSPIHRFFINLGKPFLTSSKKGASTSIYLASSNDVEGITGKYFVDRRAVASSKYSYDADIQSRFWEVSLALTGLNGEKQYA